MADVSEFPGGQETAGVACAEVAVDEAAYAWGGLAAGDRERVDQHRRECAACDQRLLAAERVVADLDSAGPRLPPPPELRRRVLAAIANLEQPPHTAAAASAGLGLEPARPEPPRHLTAGTTRELPPRHAAPSRRQELNKVDHGPRGRELPEVGAGRLGRWELRVERRRAAPFLTGVATGVVGLAAAAALVVVLLVRPDLLGQASAPQSQFGPSDQPAAPPGITLPWQAAPAAARLIELRSATGPGRGLLTFDAQTKRGVLLLEGVSAVDGADYLVWLVDGPQRVWIGTLNVDAQGVGALLLPEPLPLERPQRIEVSRRGAQPETSDGGVLSGSF